MSRRSSKWENHISLKINIVYSLIRTLKPGKKYVTISTRKSTAIAHKDTQESNWQDKHLKNIYKHKKAQKTTFIYIRQVLTQKGHVYRGSFMLINLLIIHRTKSLYTGNPFKSFLKIFSLASLLIGLVRLVSLKETIKQKKSNQRRYGRNGILKNTLGAEWRREWMIDKKND